MSDQQTTIRDSLIQELAAAASTASEEQLQDALWAIAQYRRVRVRPRAFEAVTKILIERGGRMPIRALHTQLDRFSVRPFYNMKVEDVAKLLASYAQHYGWHLEPPCDTPEKATPDTEIWTMQAGSRSVAPR